MDSTRRTSLILAVAFAAAALAGCGEERSPAVDWTKVKADMQKAQERRAQRRTPPPANP